MARKLIFRIFLTPALLLTFVRAQAIVNGIEVRANERQTQQVHRIEVVTFKGGPKGPRKTGFCSAGLIHERILPIAAHCLPQKEDAASLTVYLTDTSGAQTRIPVIDWEIHPTEDLALLKLAVEAPPFAEILVLPTPNQRYDYSQIEAAGYGSVTARTDEVQEGRVLRRISLRTRAYRFSQPLFTVEKGLCGGDSGSPGLVLDEQGQPIFLGVAARGIADIDPMKQCSHDGTYVHTLFYLPWIQAKGADLLSRNQRPKNLVLGKSSF